MAIRVHMSLRAFVKLFLWSLVPIGLSVVAVVMEPDLRWEKVYIPLIMTTSSLLGTISFFLFRSEKYSGSRAVFLNFCIFFLANGVVGALQSIIPKWVEFRDIDFHLLVYQYHMPVYFLSLSVSVVYLVIECMWRKSKVLGKYLATFLVVGVAWMPLFYPYFSNPRYLNETEDMQDLWAVRKALETIRANDRPHPSAREIAATISDATRGEARRLTETRVAEILPYTHENDHAILFWRPLWRSCALISSFTVAFIIGFFPLRYFRDPPGSAYLEKIAWCVLLYCVLEAIHFYYFMNVNSWEIALDFMRVGGFISLGVMFPLVYLFGLRYVFVNSIEGAYYERQLSREASRITRWRDFVDNWVIRQFVNESELDRRFLIRSERDRNAGADAKHQEQSGK